MTDLQVNLKKIRYNHHLTQREISSKLNMSTNTYNGYESQGKLPNAGFIRDFCNTFNVSADWLLGINTGYVVLLYRDIQNSRNDVILKKNNDDVFVGAAGYLLDNDKNSFSIAFKTYEISNIDDRYLMFMVSYRKYIEDYKKRYKDAPPYIYEIKKKKEVETNEYSSNAETPKGD